MSKRALYLILTLFLLTGCKSGDLSIFDMGEKSVSTPHSERGNKNSIK